MENFNNHERSLWLRLWQPFFNLSIYGKFGLVLISFLLGYLLIGLYTFYFINDVKEYLNQIVQDQFLLNKVFEILDDHIVKSGLLVAIVMILLSITSFLCIRTLVSFLDQMIYSLQILRNADNSVLASRRSSVIPVISNDKIGSVAMLVNDLTSDIRNISRFRRTIEVDETVGEVYDRLAYVFKEYLGLQTFVIWEVQEKDDSIEAVYTWPPELETEICTMSNSHLCRAKRTGEHVSSSGYPNICPVFPLADVMTHTCVPMIVSGKVLGVVQFLSLFVDCPEREKALQINLYRAGQYLKEALPVLHAKRLAVNLHEMATRDALTGLANRRFLEDNINPLIARIKRRKSSMGILMCDLDFFKKVNDEYGHDVGDQVLKTMAIILQNNVRSSDITIRYGGEEFMILLVDCEVDKVVAVAEKIRIAVEEQLFQVENVSLRKTLSIGISLYPNDTEAFWECVKFSDIALYKAKETGRNKVVRFEPSMWQSSDY